MIYQGNKCIEFSDVKTWNTNKGTKGKGWGKNSSMITMIMIDYSQKVQISFMLMLVIDSKLNMCMCIRPVHKNFFLEFPKYPSRFMLHFDI